MSGLNIKKYKNKRKKFEAGVIILISLISINIITSGFTLGVKIENKIKDDNNPPYFSLCNDPLIANANGPYEAIVDEIIQFHGSATGGSQPYINWTWDFGDGTIVHGQNPYHNYSAINNYTIYLRVIDSSGSISWAKTTANIRAPPECKLRITISTKQKWVEGENVKFDIQVSNDFGGDKTDYYYDVWIQPNGDKIDTQNGTIEGGKVNTHPCTIWLNAKTGYYSALAILYYESNSELKDDSDYCIFLVKTRPRINNYFGKIIFQNI